MACECGHDLMGHSIQPTRCGAMGCKCQRFIPRDPRALRTMLIASLERVEELERRYPCSRCGAMRSKAEGGTTFTVCDECWDKMHAERAEARAPSDAAATTRDAPANTPQRNTAPRRRLPDERASVTRTFRLKHAHRDGSVEDIQLFFTVGLYDDGTPGEVFVTADQPGSMSRGLLDAVGVLTSLLLQHGVPLEEITKKFRATSFPPASFTGDPEIPNCSSPLDLLARWLDVKFPREEEI